MWEAFREAMQARQEARQARYDEWDAARREHKREQKAVLRGGPQAAAQMAWDRGDTVFVYTIQSDLSDRSAAYNRTLNAISAIGWKLQSTTAQSGGSLLLGNSIVFTFVRPPRQDGGKDD